jgi:hypothetical protein
MKNLLTALVMILFGNSDYALSSNERTVLLSACSVARYSAAYWGEYYLNENAGGYKLCGKSNVFRHTYSY